MIRCKMRVAHSHGQTGVTKDFLQGQDVAAVLDEVTGESMPQGVGGLPFRELDSCPGQSTPKRSDGRVGLSMLLPVTDDFGF